MNFTTSFLSAEYKWSNKTQSIYKDKKYTHYNRKYTTKLNTDIQFLFHTNRQFLFLPLLFFYYILVTVN